MATQPFGEGSFTLQIHSSGGIEPAEEGVGELRAEPLIPPKYIGGIQDGGFGGHQLEGGGK